MQDATPARCSRNRDGLTTARSLVHVLTMDAPPVLGECRDAEIDMLASRLSQPGGVPRAIPEADDSALHGWG